MDHAEKRSPQTKRKMILDLTCGLKQIWFQKDAQNVIYLDKRKGIFENKDTGKGGWCKTDFNISPTIQADNKYLPFKDDVFDLILFDPPFLKSAQPRMITQYGRLNPFTWTMDIGRAAKEGFRVLKQNGFFILKWGEGYAVIKEALKLFPVKPLFGTHLNYSKHKTWWIVFRKD